MTAYTMLLVSVSKLLVQSKDPLDMQATLTAGVFLLAAGSRCPVHFDLLQTFGCSR